MRLGITVCTRGRPHMIKKCATSICEEVNSEQYDVVLIVIENNQEKSLTETFQALSSQFSNVSLTYEFEPKLGIPFARNRAVKVALAHNADWIAFIDDDEEMEAGWLKAMFNAIKVVEADAFTGPVRSIPDSPPPSWWKPREYRHTDGQCLKTAATNNTLIKSSWFLRRAEPPFRFNEQMRFTGGSDTELFHRLTDMGGTIKWVSNAYVREAVFSSRLTLYWQFNRNARGQYSYVRREMHLNGVCRTIIKFLPAAIRRSIKSAGHIVMGMVCRLFSKTKSEQHVYRGAKMAAIAFGTIRSLLGWSFQPYRKIDGY